ncbi:MAG: 16S rRNA (uracil(1498)-N(3))-methyltransferase [Rhodospirillaceae bacterium]
MADWIRLFTEHDLFSGAEFEITGDQAHYLTKVMRLGAGDDVRLFNGRHGEWRCRITDADKRACGLAAEGQIRGQTCEPPKESAPWLVFAPVKKAGTDFIIQKATELGTGRLIAVTTANTQTGRVNVDRLRANAIEAAEQTGRLSVPEVKDGGKLDDALAGWPDGRRLYMLDETGGGAPIADAVSAAPGPCAFLTGPEGGFQPGELDRLGKLPFVTRIGLGPRILRAETAGLAALAVWQAVAGDWRST